MCTREHQRDVLHRCRHRRQRDWRTSPCAPIGRRVRRRHMGGHRAVREIRIPSIDWSEVQGARAVVPVKVDWPELRLTDKQVWANALALVFGDEIPYPDQSYIEVVIEWPKGVH